MATVADAKLTQMRDKICMLIEALGLKPGQIPQDGSLTFDGDRTLYIERYVYDDNGNIVIDGDGFAREMAVVTVETDVYAVAVE